jgi:hypothetical protein
VEYRTIIFSMGVPDKLSGTDPHIQYGTRRPKIQDKYIARFADKQVITGAHMREGLERNKSARAPRNSKWGIEN